MVKTISIEQFLELKHKKPVIDVRSPVEYAKGHIPGSVNIPLFTDDERARIGTVYKQKGSDEAVTLGESYAEPKIEQYLKQAAEVSIDKNVIVYCFRGGMRSGRFSSLLDENGFSVMRLEKGYKSYRRYVQNSFLTSYPLRIIGGKTGSGKTEILQALKINREQIIDLEMLANHRGSAFGSMENGYQPATEHFENIFYETLVKLSLKSKIWIEDESVNIGRVFIPADFYKQMKKAPLVVLKMPKEFRIKRLCTDYAGEGCEPLLEGIGKIRKKLGGERTTLAIEAVQKQDFSTAASIILEYYDKCYEYGLSKKENITINLLDIEKDDPEEIALQLMEQY